VGRGVPRPQRRDLGHPQFQVELKRYAVAVLAAVAATASVEAGEGVFSAAIMATGAYVASPIPRFVCVEVVESRFPVARQRAVVTVTRVKAVVNVPEPAGTAVKPRTGAKKHPANKPVGPIVAIGSTVIWGIVEVPVRANRRDSDFNGNLGWPKGCAA
jgi:hypothetical protein